MSPTNVEAMEFYGAKPRVDLTYSDVFLVPQRSAVTSRLEVDLTPGDGTSARMPLVASNMNSVTGPRLAATLARRGGLAVLPQDLAPAALLEAIAWVKNQPVLWDSPIVFASTTTVAEAARQVPAVPGHGIVVVDALDSGASHNGAHNGAPQSRLISRSAIVGVVPTERLGTALLDATLGDLIHGKAPMVQASEVYDPRVAFDAMRALESSFARSGDVGSAGITACVIQDGVLVGTVSARSALRATLYPPSVDGDGRLCVAAAIGINGDVSGKARALIAAGVDVLVLDTAHGHQDGMLHALRAVSEHAPGIPVVAGNIVTADGVADLVDAGASILKVGVGPGAMCTTRMMTAVGRPQFSAVWECAEAAREVSAHVWADGGVRYPRDVALALAAGASSVMIGSWFAGTIESPGEVHIDADGRAYKESWGMASTKAVQARFGELDAYQRARKELFAEGISSSKIYLDPLRPGLEDLLDMITSGVRSSFTYAGASSLAEFHARARVGLQSAAGYDEGKALPVSW